MLAAPDPGAEFIDRCLGEGNGVIVWTAHLGNWEFASRLLGTHGRRVNVAGVVEGTRRDDGSRSHVHDAHVVEMNDDAMATAKLLHALRSNRNSGHSGRPRIQPFQAEVPFFGSPAAFPLGPFFLAYVSGAPIVPGVVVRQGWLRYRVIMNPPIQLPHTGNRDEDLRAGLAQAARFLEDTLWVYYDQWLNFFEFWPNGSIIQATPGARNEDVVAHG